MLIIKCVSLLSNLLPHKLYAVGKSNNGGVQPPTVCDHSVGGAAGTEYNLANTWESTCVIFKQ